MAQGSLDRLVRILAAVICAGALLSCSGSARMVREATYPPEFRYISDAEIESVMWNLAGRVHDLERLTKASEPDFASLSAVLSQIDVSARHLESDGGGSNHPYFETELKKFLGLVQRAKLDLRRTPLQITSSEEVWRACSGCHSRS